MTWREIAADQVDGLRNPLIIDVRSPSEHDAERILESVNIPLLSDHERAIVGTIYKQEGEMVARRQAVKIISPKIPAIIDDIVSLKRHGQPLVIYCWRGGLRSEAVASLLSVAGIDCLRITGGYKAWRTQVLKDLAQCELTDRTVVLHGHTGTGKTEVLQALKELGVQVIDLEQLANHRGSVFGALGLGSQPSQKNFDAALRRELKELKPGLVVFEAESRKIGKVSIPDCVLHAIRDGKPVLVNGSLLRRSERIAADYLRCQSEDGVEIEQAVALLGYLKERLGAKMVAMIESMVRTGQILEAVTLLLTDYYDPLYNKQIERARPFSLEVDADDPIQAAKTLAAWLSEVGNRESAILPQK
jgi:tRNA 2-selenouridine synthase